MKQTCMSLQDFSGLMDIFQVSLSSHKTMLKPRNILAHTITGCMQSDCFCLLWGTAHSPQKHKEAVRDSHHPTTFCQ